MIERYLCRDIISSFSNYAYYMLGITDSLLSVLVACSASSSTALPATSA